MDAKTLEALKASIRKWRLNAKAKTPGEYTVGADTCPLCAFFFTSDCDGCPVRAETKWPGCLGTPYERAFEAWWYWMYEKGPADHAHAVARDMAAFLESLLPEGETT